MSLAALGCRDIVISEGFSIDDKGSRICFSECTEYVLTSYPAATFNTNRCEAKLVVGLLRLPT